MWRSPRCHDSVCPVCVRGASSVHNARMPAGNTKGRTCQLPDTAAARSQISNHALTTVGAVASTTPPARPHWPPEDARGPIGHPGMRIIGRQQHAGPMCSAALRLPPRSHCRALTLALALPEGDTRGRGGRCTFV
jgi:hypothetical protein